MNIAILASGGDGAGMNYCLYHLYKALRKKHNIMFINKGFTGLIKGDILNFDLKYISKHKTDGGIIIKTSRCPEFKTQQGIQKAIQTIKDKNIDLLVVMGGNGSLTFYLHTEIISHLYHEQLERIF